MSIKCTFRKDPSDHNHPHHHPVSSIFYFSLETDTGILPFGINQRIMASIASIQRVQVAHSSSPNVRSNRRGVRVMAAQISRQNNAASEDAAVHPSRRQIVMLPSSSLIYAGALTLLSGEQAAQAKGGFEVVRDQQDAYQFLYPFGWQEVSVQGQDVVYKDVIEPLESVSVNYIPTDKKSVADYGDAKEVSYTLVKKVLTNVNQDVRLLNAEERKDSTGRVYYDFEYTATTPRYTRHALASVTVGNGKFYTLETGANERRWGKMADKIARVQKSFEVSDRTDY
jgi:photosystem II oxygen-evolving enhancer protein 2